MSRIRIPRKARNDLPELPEAVPVPQSATYALRPQKRPHHLAKGNVLHPILHVADGRSYTQDPTAAILPGQKGLRDPPLRLSGSSKVHNTNRNPAQPEEDHQPLPEWPLSNPFEDESPPSLHGRRRMAQAQRWEGEIIPELIPIYMKLLRETANLRLKPSWTQTPCTCLGGGGRSRTLEVTIVRFNVLEKTYIEACPCNSAAKQLLQRGVFPCAPLHPTLAVDIHVLEHVGRLFLRVAPNHTAWCDTVTDFLHSMGYNMSGKDPLRRRFTNCFNWFLRLKEITKSRVDDFIEEVRESAKSEAEEGGGAEEAMSENDDSGAENTGGTSKKERLEAGKRSRPSEYLRSRCPLCFGGDYSGGLDGLDFNAIVCIDACFTQKHNKGARDPPKQHPETSFLSEQELKEMEEYVESIRPSKPKNSTDNESPPTEDYREDFMKVPNSALADCKDSFTAADDRRQKSSTQFFDCTGIMGLLCRHDRVLWLANMTSAGEKQFYVFALIQKLFQHLPEDFHVGLLYDIGCQLDHSCHSYGFLGDVLDRLGFAISVFHAFGHCWPCQLIYHPRKRTGFGLSDGEGCERFWHSISRLIPYLRYHQRVYTLDIQVRHSEEESLTTLAQWLVRKRSNAYSREWQANEELRKCGVNEEVLKEQWAEQVKSQTKPLPKQSTKQGKNAVEEVLRLRSSVDILTTRVRELEDVTVDLGEPQYKVASAQVELPGAKSKLREAQRSLKSKESALGVEGKRRIEHLAQSPFIQHRMNALALKTRLREKLRARKFERDRLERSFRKQLNEQKIHSQIGASVKKRDPGIQELARKYNALCVQMEKLVRTKKAPQGAVAPKPIAMDELWTLDVDDTIWQDVGLTDVDDGKALPQWLADEAVRTGIRAMLERDRCREEIERLQHERDALQEWFAEEWHVVLYAIDIASSEDVIHQLELRKRRLLELCATWYVAFGSDVCPSLHVRPWGPDELAIRSIGLDMRREHVSEVEMSVVDADESDEGSVSEEEDYQLIEHLETL
ncbi:hypothetical protein V5O48_013194, partial [Marasmius crinis-equi]